MINKELFYDEIEKMNLMSRLDKKDLEILIDFCEGNLSNVSIDGEYLANKIISDLFATYNNELFVPWKFFESELGKAILFAKFELGTDVYFITDIVELTGYSRQYLSKEIRLGNIESKRRHGTIYFTESEVNKYLKKKGKKTIAETKQERYNELKENIITGNFERESPYGVE